jgi:hypothetical protein
MMISDEMVEKYKKGSKPEHIATQEVDELKPLLLETINQTETDLESKIFINYQDPTSAGIVLKGFRCDAFNDSSRRAAHWNYNEHP